jgi:hypothetical protein
MSQTPNAKSPVPGFFQDIQETLRLKFRGWETDLPHQGEKGGIRERRVKDFLRIILPSKYGIGSGHIIDSKGQASYQSDIVIYDAHEGLALPIDDYYSLFPCECVYAVIEIKSELNASDGENGPSGTIYECLESNTKLKSLYREGHNLSPIHYIVFSYTTKWKTAQADKIKLWFEGLGEKYIKKLPEVIFILEPCFVWGTSGPSGYNKRGEMTNIYDREPLLYFVADLVFRLSQTKVYTPNLWHEYTNWLPGDVRARIYKKPKR